MKSRTKATLVAFMAAMLLLAGLGTTAAFAAPDDGQKGGNKENQCNDGIDNDLDGFTDEDDGACQVPGCLPSNQTPKKCQEANDNPPTPDPACSDGLDNDEDDLVDEDDPGCDGPDDDDETDPDVDTCTDGIDNDEDGQTDGGDQDCPEGPETTFQADCEDGIDNDEDGATDFGSDPGCESADDDDETDIIVEPPAADPCTGEADDPGLLTEDTLGQTLFDAGLGALSPLTEDPDGDGMLSGAVKGGGTGTPIEVVTDEVGCVVDLLIDAELGGDL